MADGDDKIQFSLDLDSEQFLSKLKDVGTQLVQLAGHDEDLKKLVAQFKELAEVGAVVAVAYYGVKAAINTIIEAEQIQAINAQFENLAQNIGIAGDKLKDGLQKASGGLIEDTELLKTANKAMISMGANAARLPEIMELARKATAAGFGGSLQENFEALSQAISTGQTKMLRGIGITIDSTKALRDYAKQTGNLAGELNETGRQHAIMNAVLEKGALSYKNATAGASQTEASLTRIKVVFQEIGEVFTLVFEKVLGPTVRSMIATLEHGAKSLKDSVVATLGTGAEKANAELSVMEKQVAAIQRRLAENEKFHGIYAPDVIEQDKKHLDELTQKIEKLKAVKGTGEQFGPTDKELQAGPAEAGGETDKEKVNKRRAEDLVSLADATLKLNEAQAENAMTEQDLNNKLNDRLGLIQAERDAQLANLAQKKEDAQGDVTRLKTISAEKDLINEQYHQREVQMAEELSQIKQKTYQQQLSSARSMGDQIAASAKLSGAKASSEWQKSGGLGGAAMGAFQNRTMQAFKNIGDGSQSVADAMKTAFLGMLGDVASKQGEAMFLSSFETWPIWPTPKTAGGLALIALGGALGAASGGGATSVPGGASGGGSTSAGDTGSGSSGSGTATVAAEAQKQKSVTIQVQGSYFETEQTKTRLLEMIRESTDATDFKYQQIGGS